MTDTTPTPSAALYRLIVAAGSAIFDDRIPPDMPAGEAAMRGVLDALPVLLREDSPAGEDLRARLGVINLNQRRLMSEWEAQG